MPRFTTPRPADKPPNLDRQKLAMAARIVELCGEQAERAVAVIFEVMNDPESRQRLAAATKVLEYAQGHATERSQQGVKVLVLNTEQVKKMERSVIEAKVVR